MRGKEVNFSVPWGHIACQIHHGDDANAIVLFIHDLHDNAASFDALISNFKDSCIAVAMDLPGHGKSSPAHSFAVYHHSDYLLAVKCVTFNLLQRYANSEPTKRIALVAHGKSAHLALLFTQLYPRLISSLILFDGMYDDGVEARDFATASRMAIESYFTIAHAATTPRECTFEDVLDLYRKKYACKEIEMETDDVIHALAQRSSKQLENGNYLRSNDPQLENMSMDTFGQSYMIDLLKKYPILCPVLILCTETKAKQHMKFLSVLKLKNSKGVVIVKMPVDHCHIRKPVETSKHLCNFLKLKQTSSLVNKL